MINAALQFLITELNTYCGLRTGNALSDIAVAASLHTLDGTPNSATTNKLVMSMVNIEQDPVYKAKDTFRRLPDGRSEKLKAELNVNLYLLFIANFSSYSEAMKSITYVASFFQLNPFFDFAQIDTIEQPGRMSFELFSMTFEQQNNLWGTIGAKYMPSIMYKAGMLQVRDEQVEDVAPPVTQVEIAGQGL